MKGVFVFVLTITVGYLIGAFTAWEWNPGEWPPFGRYMVSLIGVFLGLFLGVSAEIVRE